MVSAPTWRCFRPAARIAWPPVAAALDACFRACTDYPELPRTIGLLESDLDEAHAILTGLKSADKDQAEVMTRGRDKTFDRNAVQMRIKAAVDMISSRGQMVFRSDKDVRDRFEALVSTAGPLVGDQEAAPPAAPQ